MPFLTQTISFASSDFVTRYKPLRCWLGFLLFIVSVFTCTLVSATPNVSRLSPDNGLSQGVVYTMKLDSKKQLWLATESNLDRFDGTSVEHMRAALNLSSDIVWDFDFVTDTKLHVATADAGLIEMDLLTGNARYLQRDSKGAFSRAQAIYIIREDAQQERWYANELSVYQLNKDGNLSEVFTFTGKDPAVHHIRDILRFEDTLIIATSKGLYQFDLSNKLLKPLQYLPENALEDQFNSKTLLLHDKHLLIGTVRGLYRLPISALRQPSAEVLAETLLPKHNVWKIKPSQQYGILLATDSGLLQLDAEAITAKTLFQPGSTAFAYADDTILDFIELDDGNFWLGSRGDGAYFWNSQFAGFENVFNRTGENTLSHNVVFGLHSTATDLWIGTQNGLNRYHWHSGEIKQFLVNGDSAAVESAATIYGIYPHASDRYLWLLTAVSLVQFDTVSNQLVVPTSAQNSDVFQQYIYSVTQTADNDLLIINAKGAFRIKNDSSAQPLKSLSLFLSSPQDAQWFGADPAAVNEFFFFYQGAIWRYRLEQDKVSLVYQLPEQHKDKVLFGEGMQQVDQSLWFLISGLGLVELDSTNFTLKSTFFNPDEPSLSTSILYALQKDNQDYLWMSSHSGLWRFNPKLRLLRQFTSRDGLAYNEFNGSSGHFSHHNNKMVFGSMRGVSIFEANQFIAQKQAQPTLYFTNVSLESKKLVPQLIPAQQQELKLAHDDYGLRVQVSAFDYKLQNDTQYRFDLSGSMELPDYIKPFPYLSLPNLTPGKYSLSVSAFDPATEQYSKPALMQISVDYPPWRSPLAYALYVVMVLSMVMLWLRSKIKQRTILLEQHNALRQVKNKLELALAVASSDVWEADLNQNCLIHSSRMLFIFPTLQDTYSMEDYLAKLHPDDRASYYQNWQALKDNESTEFNCIYRIKTNEGQWRWFKDVGKLSVLQSDKPQQIYGLYTDITSHKLTEQELEHLSHYDQVTGLPNRNLLQQYLTQAENGLQFSAFIVIKLLQFSEIKSAFGDLVTNSALLQLSTRMRSIISTPNLLIHAAESTFVVALQNSEAGDVSHISERLLSLINTPITVHEQDITISGIAGTACSTNEPYSGQQLLNQAELALRAARDSGGYQHYSYQTGLLEQTKQKFILQQQLRDAISQNKLLNYYQPIINAKSGVPVGVELLLRWNNGGQFIPPDKFIPIAEQCGLIDQLTCLSLATACEDILLLQNQGVTLYLSINLTATQLCSHSILAQFKKIILEKGVSPKLIRLEITESSLIQNKGNAIHNMSELRDAGFQIFLDDFGTGYSSLKYIQDFPLDAIKIDRSFVSNITKSNNTAIIDTIITLADSLGVVCIAEGVETLAERDYLLSKNCHYMQGYLYSKPVPIEQLLALYTVLSSHYAIFDK